MTHYEPFVVTEIAIIRQFRLTRHLDGESMSIFQYNSTRTITIGVRVVDLLFLVSVLLLKFNVYSKLLELKMSPLQYKYTEREYYRGTGDNTY